MDEEAIKKEGPHKYFGIELNHFTWSMLQKANRTPEEDDLMIHAAHGSHFHWLQDGANVNKQRGEWLISHVYAVLNIPERAMYHAKKCIQVTIDDASEMEDFDLAYADEAMARALACGGNTEESKKYITSAFEKGQKITDKEAKNYFDGDFNSGPWYQVQDFQKDLVKV